MRKLNLDVASGKQARTEHGPVRRREKDIEFHTILQTEKIIEESSKRPKPAKRLKHSLGNTWSLMRVIKNLSAEEADRRSTCVVKYNTRFEIGAGS